MLDQSRTWDERVLFTSDWKLRKKFQPKTSKPVLVEEPRWSADDFAVRHNYRRGCIESYNKRTGKVLYQYPNEAFAETEAWADIREEFGGA